jgi:hypothetical protein
VIAAKEQWVVEKMVELIENEIFDENNLPYAISVLGVIGVGGQKVIEVLNTLLKTTKASETYLRFIITDSLLKIDSNKASAISELENLLPAGITQGIGLEIVSSLLTDNIGNQTAVQALHQILEKMEGPRPLLSIQSLLEQPAVNSEEIIKMLLEFWGDRGLKFNMNGVISGMLEKNAINNKATIEHALNLLINIKFRYSTLSMLGRIAVGHKKTIREVVKILIQNESTSKSCHQLAETLKMIATKETGGLVISQLKNYVTQESSESNDGRYYCLDVLLHYAQILPYQEFYKLWEIDDLPSENELP